MSHFHMLYEEYITRRIETENDDDVATPEGSCPTTVAIRNVDKCLWMESGLEMYV